MRQELRQEIGITGENRTIQESQATTQDTISKGNTTMIRIGIVGVGFMGMMHYVKNEH
jgi:hypothetical protein